jgi:Family of unknown function (DUF5994)
MKTPNSTAKSTLPDTFVRHFAPAVHRAGTPAASDGGRVRLTLSASIGRGALDGAWWPRSRNLETELADLVDHFPATSGRTVHAVYSLPDWRPAHRRIKVKGGMIKVGCFPSDDSHRVLIGLSSGETLQIMVIPPDSSPTLAHAAMATAAAPTNGDSAATILKDAQESETADAAARWSDDGGLWWEPPPTQSVRRGPWRT